MVSKFKHGKLFTKRISLAFAKTQLKACALVAERIHVSAKTPKPNELVKGSQVYISPNLPVTRLE